MERRHGFTLVEMLISVALLALVMVYMTQSFLSNNRAYVVIDQVAESQQSLRAVAALLEHDLRHAGMMVPESAAICGSDSTAGPDLLFVSDSDAVEPASDLAPYDGPRVQGAVTNVTGVNTQITLSLDSLLVESGAPVRAAYDNDADGTNDSDFRVNSGAIVVDLLDSGRGAACGVVQQVDLANERVQLRMATAPLAAFAGAVQLVVIPAHVYRVDAQSLSRNGVLLSQGIEDLQLAYFFDLDEDNVQDGNEMRGVSGANYTPAAVDHSLLRQVRLNLVSRTRVEDNDFPVGQFQATENRAAPAGNDGFRRRVHTSTVMIRNVGNRA